MPLIYKYIRQKQENKGTKEVRKQKTVNKMITVGPYLSINTLNISGLNLSNQKDRVAD